MNEVHRLADELLDAQSRFDPLNATMLGVPGHDHRLADPSDTAEDELRARAERIAVRAEQLSALDLDPDDRITAA